jgi:hypothetical protein
MIETLNTSSTYQLFHAIANHNDANTAVVSDAGSKNYVVEDTQGKVVNYWVWSTTYTATLWQLKAIGGKVAFAADVNGNCYLGASSGSSHVINRPVSTEADVVVNFQANGVSFGYIQHAAAGTINGGNTGLAINKNTSSLRSINAAGTVNATGADYAEYMRKAPGVGHVLKGQIIGLNSRGEVTDKWSESHTFLIKSTDPSYVGNDTWHIGPRPFPPAMPVEGTDEGDLLVYTRDKAAYDEAIAAWEAEYEAARATVDRIAFCGQVPVNILGAAPGQYIVPVPGDFDSIAAEAISGPTFEQHLISVGKVSALEEDGRARVIVKVG